MDFLKDFFRESAKRKAQMFLLAASLFLVIAIVGAYPPTKLTLSTPSRVGSAVVGGIFSLIAVVLAFRREASPLKDCSKYKISITSPKDGASVTRPITFTGRCKSLPKGYELWVFSIAIGGHAYWPQNSSEIKNKTWEVRAHPVNWQPNARRRYGVFLVGKNGQQLVRYYKIVKDEIKSKGVSPPGIPELTPDIVQCGAAHEVTLI